MTEPTLFDIPTEHLYHTGDPDTSRHAAEQTNITDRCRAVLDRLRFAPATADELDDVFTDWPPRTAARRISDLHNLAMIEDSGERRMTRYGRPGIVWMAVAA
jgi:hypothetical protein